MPMSHAERGRLGGLKRAYTQTAEQRHEQARNLYLAGAVKAVVDRAPELPNDQRARIRAILLPAVPAAETLALTEDDGPGRTGPAPAARRCPGRCSPRSGRTDAGGRSRAAGRMPHMPEPVRAAEHARHVIEGNGDPANRNWWPTRVGTARIEQALAFAQQGRIDEAARTAADVLSADFLRRSTVWRAAELDKMLRKGHADVAEVEDFHERYLLARRAIQN